MFLFVIFQIKWVEQQVSKRRVKRDVQSMFSDPMWPQQWYLVSKCLLHYTLECCSGFSNDALHCYSCSHVAVVSFWHISPAVFFAQNRFLVVYSI